MALYAFDGTGNEDQERDEKDSNVVPFFNAYVDPKKNVDPEAFGIGGHRRVRQALERLENNLDAGDDTIDVVGFSRGAALAMSFANEIASKLPGVDTRFVGVFDVVAQFGVPGKHVNAGHVVSLPPNVKCCRHAMAMDESRVLFPLTRLCDRDGKHDDRLVEVCWIGGCRSRSAIISSTRKSSGSSSPTIACTPAS
jgi:uncharacterized protein (DUF2235 family)